MGIQHLNQFLKKNTAASIKIISFKDLTGKKVAVDANIYMYRYATEETLIESMYTMLSLFRHYNISPIFIFDGKPPPEKREILLNRRKNRKDAYEEYDKLQNSLSNGQEGKDDTEKSEIVERMKSLKKKFVHINKNDICTVKRLIASYGACHYTATGEADELCAWLAVNEKVWGVMSEDMDMFAYGCPNIIRYVSLLKQTCVWYDLRNILFQLKLTQRDLREICILSGTDYNCNKDNNVNGLHSTLKLFKRYYSEKSQDTESFYEWLSKNTEQIKDYDYDYDYDYEKLKKIYDMFDLKGVKENYDYGSIQIVNGPICKNSLNEILEQDGFIFP